MIDSGHRSIQVTEASRDAFIARIKREDLIEGDVYHVTARGLTPMGA